MGDQVLYSGVFEIHIYQIPRSVLIPHQRWAKHHGKVPGSHQIFSMAPLYSVKRKTSVQCLFYRPNSTLTCPDDI
jgi:hypothetical protein